MGGSSLPGSGAAFSQLKERWRCVSVGPVAMLRSPPGTSSKGTDESAGAQYV